MPPSQLDAGGQKRESLDRNSPATFGVYLFYSDAQGLNLSSIDASDVSFLSKTTPGKAPCYKIALQTFVDDFAYNGR